MTIAPSHGTHHSAPRSRGRAAPAHAKPAIPPACPKPGRRKPGHGQWIAALAVLLLAAAGLWLALAPSGDSLTPEEHLVQQMHAAAQGRGPAIHTFGGALSVTRGERGLNVVAKEVPSKACVSAAWRLARDGVVIVNGTLPMRISAGRLAELCADDSNVLTWVPEAAAQ